MISRLRGPWRVITTAFTVALAAPWPSALAAGVHLLDPPAASATILSPSGQRDLDPDLQQALRSAPTAAQWPNHHYVKLLDLGNVTVRSDGTVIATYRETFKLFDPLARDLAEVRLPPFNSSYQNFHVVSARTIKKDGTVIDVKRADMREGGVAADYLMYDDARIINFSMPGIEDDCVIDYSYEEVTHPMLLPGQFTTYWGFNDTYPIMMSRYVVHMPTDKPAS